MAFCSMKSMIFIKKISSAAFQGIIQWLYIYFKYRYAHHLTNFLAIFSTHFSQYKGSQGYFSLDHLMNNRLKSLYVSKRLLKKCSMLALHY